MALGQILRLFLCRLVAGRPVATVLLLGFASGLVMRCSGAVHNCSGHQLAVTRVEPKYDIWTVENFIGRHEGAGMVTSSFHRMGIRTWPSVEGLVGNFHVSAFPEEIGLLHRRVAALFPDLRLMDKIHVRRAMSAAIARNTGKRSDIAATLQSIARMVDKNRLPGLRRGSDWKASGSEKFNAVKFGNLATVMVYIGGNGDGGILFNNTVSISASFGRAVIWRNCLETGEVDPHTHHEHIPLLTGAEWTATWHFIGYADLDCVPPPEPRACVIQPPLGLQPKIISGYDSIFPLALIRHPGIGLYADCTSVETKYEDLIHDETRELCYVLGLHPGPPLPQDIEQLFDVRWLAEHADHQILTLAYRLSSPESLQGVAGRFVQEWVRQFNASDYWIRDEILDRLRIEPGTSELLVTPAHRRFQPSGMQQTALRLVKAQNAGEIIQEDHDNGYMLALKEALEEERDNRLQEYIHGLPSAARKGFYTMEGQLHRLLNARVVVADHAALLRDFGAEELCGHSGHCDGEQINEWILANAAYMSDGNFKRFQTCATNRSMMEAVEEEPASMIAIRPPKYGRAAQFHITCCRGSRLNTEDRVGLEVKGYGIDAFSDIDHESLLSSDFRLQQEHASGLLPMGWGLREYALYNLMRRVLRHNAMDTDGAPKANFTLMPVYAVIDAGFDIPNPVDDEHTTHHVKTSRGENQPYTRAALTVRGPTIRSQKHQVFSDMQHFVEAIFAPYGISSNMNNFASFRDQVVEEFGESRNNGKRTNIQMDADQHSIVDLEEWMLGDWTQRAEGIGLPQEWFVQDSWAECIEEYRKLHAEGLTRWPWANAVFRCGLGPLQKSISQALHSAYRLDYDLQKGAWESSFLAHLRELHREAPVHDAPKCVNSGEREERSVLCW